jgi:hypothetical protein
LFSNDEIFPLRLTPGQDLLALLPGWAFTREPDAATEFDELVVRAVPGKLP